MRPQAQAGEDAALDPGPSGAEAGELCGLLTRSARGDDTAFELLFRAVSGPVYGTALRTLRSPAHAEEVAQEVLLEVWRTAAAYRPERGTVLAWVLTIAHHRAVDRVRSARAAADRERRLALPETDPECEPPEEQAARSLDRVRVRSALAGLSAAQREAVVLAYYGGYTQREIAQRLALPLGTVKTRIRDGLRRLRDTFDPGRAPDQGPVTDTTGPAGTDRTPRRAAAIVESPTGPKHGAGCPGARTVRSAGGHHGSRPTARPGRPAPGGARSAPRPRGPHRGEVLAVVTPRTSQEDARVADGPGLPTGGVARRLGVSPTTVRSWERRYGIGPADRRAGHHRRWSPQDIAVLEAMCRLTARGVPPGEAARAALARRGADATGPIDETGPTDSTGPEDGAADPARGPAPGGSRTLRVGTVSPECRGLARAAVRLDAPEVTAILRGAVERLGVVDAWTEVMMPALQAVGRKWAVDGEQYVEVEHLLSWHVSSVLRGAAVEAVRLRPVRPVLLAATPGEQHTLPLEATAAALTERALPFRMLGAAVPPRALLDAVHRLGPGAVMIWSQDRQTADRGLVRQVSAGVWGPRGSRGRATVVAAGPGWGRTRSPEEAATPRTLAGAVDLLEEAVTA
ncbi:sigma-70 family RNA polymerase sigma factor [Kitasatospora purpeofusca]|uniref:sigma-70 family RNA polymerase sigma factor n=1 Tax=Kitasatospora purpeofusca TaxID=67352 RepID=UPI002B1D1CD4|nr:sigma-70 family RNA polymerase sigma factor [Kitasatospora purpeofusca]